jgi:hypothetical protein
MRMPRTSTVAALLLSAAAAALMPAPTAAQQSDITRRSYTFLDDRLVINVLGRAPGELQVVRGEPGRVEVAARSTDGFPGFGLGGNLTRELRLTAVGADLVQFLVVVPEHVRVTVQLPDGANASLPSRTPAAAWHWGDRARAAAADESRLPIMPTMANGMYLVHATTWAPSSVDVPSLRTVRSLSLRFEGTDFRIAASRPLSVSPGSPAQLQLHLDDVPIDIVVYVPRGSGAFQLRSGRTVLADLVSGRARALCGNVVVQRPTANQDWLSFHPQDGHIECGTAASRR